MRGGQEVIVKKVLSVLLTAAVLLCPFGNVAFKAFAESETEIIVDNADTGYSREEPTNRKWTKSTYKYSFRGSHEYIDKESNKTTTHSTNLSGFPMAFCALDNGYALLIKDGKQSEIFIKLLLLSENMEVYGEADLPVYYFNDESSCRMWYSDGNFYIASEGSDSLLYVSESDMGCHKLYKWVDDIVNS